VPKVRAILEYTNFIILFVLYVQALEGLNKKKVNARESLFIVYALGKAFFILFMKRRGSMGLI